MHMALQSPPVLTRLSPKRPLAPPATLIKPRQSPATRVKLRSLARISASKRPVSRRTPTGPRLPKVLIRAQPRPPLSLLPTSTGRLSSRVPTTPALGKSAVSPMILLLPQATLIHWQFSRALARPRPRPSPAPRERLIEQQLTTAATGSLPKPWLAL